MKHVGIIGAGPSGVLAGLFLDKKRFTYEILEGGSTSGGHAGSYIEDGFTFDYGPHIMFSKNKDVLNFMISSLGNNVNQSKRNNKVSFKNRLIKYPFENDLKSRPLEDNFACVNGYLNNPYVKQYRHPKNLEQWLLKTFGLGICERYLFPYNEKVWNIPVKELSMYWADRIPNPPAEDIIRSAIGYETEGYLHQLMYNYPKRGGYSAITNAWAKKVNPPTYNYKVDKIDRLPNGQYKICSGSKEKVFDLIIPTMPIHQLIKTGLHYIDQARAEKFKLLNYLGIPISLVFIAVVLSALRDSWLYLFKRQKEKLFGFFIALVCVSTVGQFLVYILRYPDFVNIHSGYLYLMVFALCIAVPYYVRQRLAAWLTASTFIAYAMMSYYTFWMY